MGVPVWSEPQARVIAHGLPDIPFTWCVAIAAVRSGKSYAMAFAFASAWFDRLAGGHDHIIAAPSVPSARRNVARDVVHHLRSFGLDAAILVDAGTRIRVAPVNGLPETTAWIVGAHDKGATRRIQGATAELVLLDEGPEMPESFFNMVASRMSVPGAKAWLSGNPASPRHFLKTKLVDRAEAWNAQLVHFSLEDNPSLADDYKRRLRSSMVSHWAERFVEGRWVAPAGRVFRQYSVIDRLEPFPGGAWTLGLDYGPSGTTAAVLFSCNRRGRARALASFEHDGYTDGVRTDTEQADALASWFENETGSPAVALRPRVYVDPRASAGLKRLLNERGFVVANGESNVTAGLSATASSLAGDDIVIAARCEPLLRELEGYEWDEASVERGIERPRKVRDHSVDALRYFAASNRPVVSLRDLPTYN